MLQQQFKDIKIAIFALERVVRVKFFFSYQWQNVGKDYRKWNLWNGFHLHNVPQLESFFDKKSSELSEESVCEN